jgi:hypothetical protein
LDYRVDFLSSDDRLHSSWFQAKDDTEAIEIALSRYRHFPTQEGFELWQGGRHVPSEKP